MSIEEQLARALALLRESLIQTQQFQVIADSWRDVYLVALEELEAVKYERDCLRDARGFLH